MDHSRIRVLEPPEGIPARNMPVLVGALDRSATTAGTLAFTTALLAVLGLVLLVNRWYGIAVPVFLLVFTTPISLYYGFLTVAGSLPMRKLVDKPFRLVNGLDGAVVAGSRVSVPLDGRWLVVRLPAPFRAQLAAQRRLWVLGRFVLLPGVLSPRRGAFRDAPKKGSAPFAVEPVSPGRLLSLQRRLLASYYSLSAGLTLVVAAFSVWIALDLPDRGSILVPYANVLAVLCVLGTIGLVITALVMTRPVPEPQWTELAVVSGPASVNLFGMVTLEGQTVLPDGRQVTVRAGGSDPSLAANIAATGRLWVLGVPVGGKAAKAGVPGHAVFGPVKFGS
ncbi:hypothetical protein [Amycolatopsis sp. NPDC051071]|uniref:hypothetical protein n=1 Tax=Amycolatopsis sp. NPDC051071 TaxID=3154637 RepID=UPI00343AB2D9